MVFQLEDVLVVTVSVLRHRHVEDCDLPQIDDVIVVIDVAVLCPGDGGSQAWHVVIELAVDLQRLHWTWWDLSQQTIRAHLTSRCQIRPEIILVISCVPAMFLAINVFKLFIIRLNALINKIKKYTTVMFRNFTTLICRRSKHSRALHWHCSHPIVSWMYSESRNAFLKLPTSALIPLQSQSVARSLRFVSKRSSAPSS